MAQSYAATQAAGVSRSIEGLRRQLVSAAKSDFAVGGVSTTASPVPDDDADASPLAATAAGLETREQMLRAYFPDAISLRFIPLSSLGTARLDGQAEGLRNLIELDLVRRASNGEQPMPEAYQQDGEWVLSLAQAVTSDRKEGESAVLLVSFSGKTLSALLSFPPGLTAGTGGSPGSFTLEQRVYSGKLSKDITIATLGTPSGLPTQSSDVPNSNWRVQFQPSRDLARLLDSRVNPDYDALAVFLLLSLLGLLLTVILIRRRQKQVCAHPEVRAAGSPGAGAAW